MSTSEKELVQRLAQSRVFREYESAFRGALGLPLVLTPPETWGLPLQEDPNESPFCHLMAGTGRTCASCLETHARLLKRAGNDAATSTCFSGMSDSAVPVKIGDFLVGFLRTGHVFTHPPTEADFQATMKSIAARGVLLDVDELRAAYFATKVVPIEQYRAILQLLKVFAEHLASVCNQILVTGEFTENPQVNRVKEFIALHMTDDLRLADCARTAHVSPFYFCKMFKRSTGLSFTHYLSRLRTEQAKTRLMDSHARVSEVAYAVGFQSLSQFNRVFKRVTGQSPTGYRSTLPSGVSSSRMPRDLGAEPARPSRPGVPYTPIPRRESNGRTPSIAAPSSSPDRTRRSRAVSCDVATV